MSDAKVTFAGDAASLLAEHKKIEDAKNKEIAGLKALLAESKKTYSEEQKHLREKQAALDKTRTAQQVYNDQMQKWFNLMATGKITLAEFNRLKGVETKALNDSTNALKKTEQAQRELEKSQSLGAKATTIGAQGLAMFATKALLAAKAIGELAAEQKRQREGATGTVASIDELSRDYAVQSGIKTEDQRQSSITNIMKAARENAVTPAVAFETASQLASSGFKDVEGNTLDVALKIIKSSDVRKGSPKDYIEGAARFLEANKMEMSGKNLLDIGVAMRGIVDTPVQASDLAEFAKSAPDMRRAGVDWQTQLAMSTVLRHEYEAPIVGTRMANISKRLQQMRGDSQAMEALDVLGLNPDDIDSIGETMPTALQRINNALTARPIEEQSILLGKMFNNENASHAGELMAGLGRVETFKKSFKDRSLFDAGVNFQLQGHNAETMRADIDLQMDQLSESEKITKRTILLKEIERNKLERSKTEGIVGKLAKKAIDVPYQFAFEQSKDEFSLEIGSITEEEALQRSKTGMQVFNGWQTEQQKQEAMKRLDKTVGTYSSGPAGDPQAAAMAEQNAHLRTIAEAVTNPANKPVVNPNSTGRTDK